jgi:hypothetical protein
MSEKLVAQIERLEAENAELRTFIRRFSRWVETPLKPDLFFGKLNLLYLDAEPFDSEREAREAS